MIDFIILAFLTLWLIWSNHQIAKRENYGLFQRWFLQGLSVYHICFSFVFHEYILTFGGDASRYWDLTAEISQNPDTWWGYFGTGTFFIQWINYVPSKVLGLKFISGNMLYALFSFIGIRLLYSLFLKTSSLKKDWPGNFLCALVFMLPNLHFWTSGVGKESFVFVGWVCILVAIQLGKKYWIYGFLGIVLLFMVRPISGFLALTIGIASLVFSRNFNLSKSWYLILGGLILGLGMVYKILLMTHIQEISWDALMKFQAGQFEFLKGFQATTEIPMEDHSLPFQLWSLYFRPFWTDLNGFWFFCAALENTVSLLLILVGMISFSVSNNKKMPQYLIWGLVMVIVMSGIYLMNLNNLGLMMRMKSSLMIFLHLSAVYWLLSKRKSYNCERF